MEHGFSYKRKADWIRRIILRYVIGITPARFLSTLSLEYPGFHARPIVVEMIDAESPRLAEILKGRVRRPDCTFKTKTQWNELKERAERLHAAVKNTDTRTLAFSGVVARNVAGVVDDDEPAFDVPAAIAGGCFKDGHSPTTTPGDTRGP